MDTQPKIPTLKDSQKPQVKIRGLEAGVTLFDRLKQFKKKDLAFILAGLGTLFMAPLAEHFMMSPESADGQQLKQGWGGNGANKGIFDGGNSGPYDPGTSNLAPGGAVGGGSDIITPLNVRDPSALVMGPGATQQPPTNSVMPATPPPSAPVTHSDSDLKDALAASARGVGAAAHAAKALLPVPKIALAGSGGLRGLGVVSGGTSAVAGGGPISSNGIAPGRAAGSNSLAGVRGGNNIKSISRSSTGGGSGNDAALKAAGDAAAGMFNKGGSAYQSATDAAAQAIPAGGGALGGGGAGGTGANDKAFGGDQNKDAKSVGESLAFLKQKAMQEAQIALWAKEQEAGDNRLEALKIRNSMAEAFSSKLAGIAADQVGCIINNQSNPNCPTGDTATTYNCLLNNQTYPPVSNVVASYQKCTSDPSAKGPQAKKVWLCGASSGAGGGSNICSCDNGSPTNPLYTNCTTSGTPPDGAGSDPAKTGSVDTMDPMERSAVLGVRGAQLGPLCKKFATGANSSFPMVKAYYGQLMKAGAALESARDNGFYGSSGDCGAQVTVDKSGTAAQLIADGANALTGAGSQQGAQSALDQIKAAVTLDDPKGKMPCKDAECKTAASKWSAANGIITAQLDAVDTNYNAAMTGLTPPTDTQDKTVLQNVKDDKDALAKTQAAIKSQLGDVKTAADSLNKGLRMLGGVVGQIDASVAPGSNGAPTLQQVFEQNAAYEQKSGYKLTVPTPAGQNPPANAPTTPTPTDKPSADSLAAAVQAYNAKNAAAPLQVPIPKPGTADQGGNVDGAIGTAKTGITSIATDVSTVKTATANGTTVTPDQLTNFSGAGTSLSSMQLTESAYVDQVKRQLPDPTTLPKAGQQ